MATRSRFNFRKFTALAAIAVWMISPLAIAEKASTKPKKRPSPEQAQTSLQQYLVAFGPAQVQPPATTDPTDTALQAPNAPQSRIRTTNSFKLNNEELHALDLALTGLTEDLIQQGRFQTVETFQLGSLAQELVQRMYSSLSSVEWQQIQRLRFEENGAIAQWLIDEGWSPEVFYILREAAADRDIDFDQLAKERGFSSGRIYRELHCQIPTPINSSLDKGLASRMRTQDKSRLRAQAFELGPDGRPRLYDPSLQNLLEHTRFARAKIAATVLRKRTGARGYLHDLVNDRSQRYLEMIELITHFERAVDDLQGIFDSIRFKATLAVNTKQAQELDELLIAAKALRGEWIKTGAHLFSIENLSQMEFVPAYREFMERGDQVSKLLIKTRKEISVMIDSIDKILGDDESSVDRYARDTPFEIQFKMDEMASKRGDLASRWTEIKSHRYIIEERLKTAHWTTTRTETTTDSEGRTSTRVVTDHHYSSSTEEDYATFYTPSGEETVSNQIENLRKRLRSAVSENEIASIRSEIEILLARHKTYTAAEPTGGHDYSDKYQDRNLNLVKQLKSLLEESFIAGARQSSQIAPYTRTLREAPTYETKVLEFLGIDDSRNQVVRHTVLAVAGSVVGSGAAISCIYYFLNN